MSYVEQLFGLEGKTALVVGGSGILGGAIARALAYAGAKTAVSYSGNPEGATGVCDLIQQNGGVARPVKIDVKSEILIKEGVESISGTLGIIDILVNAPGVNSDTPLDEITGVEWDRIMDVNLKGVFLTSRVVAGHMKENGTKGSIINISSASADVPLSKVFTYSISKAGINNMTRFLAREWAEDGIRVNTVTPGFFPAEQNREILTGKRTDAIFSHTPMRRFGEPEELAGAILFLASGKASSFVTGSDVTVDGGFTAMTI
jgi:NAD(P)-dependent dehydrogenase (short-subunit alcohol dehydrogenase family)